MPAQRIKIRPHRGHRHVRFRPDILGAPHPARVEIDHREELLQRLERLHQTLVAYPPGHRHDHAYRPLAADQIEDLESVELGRVLTIL